MCLIKLRPARPRKDANKFFEDVEQPEGREVDDNTQKDIVLMHVDALRSRVLNHRPYNLGWGHNYCNLIQGYKDISTFKSLKAGDKVYISKMNKVIALFEIGKDSIEKGMNILGAHLDSPRLDAKQNPLYEKEN